MARPAVERAMAPSGNADSQQNNSDASGQQSEWCEMQQLRRKVDELESLLEVNSHILSNVCHEFRSMLTAVRGYTKRVLEGCSGPINDAQRDDLAVAQKNTRRLLDLASHSLPFVAEQRLHVASFDLRELWQQVARRLRFRLREKALTLREHIPPGPVIINADRPRLETVFEIILANAISCSSEGCEITARLSYGADAEVTATVLVPGALLPAQVLDRIFEHQDEPSAPETGAGRPRLVGLALAHDLVWLHGGRLAVRTVAGEDTLFAITLPVLCTKPVESLIS
jgi:signal transduction histidine kinase